MNKGQTSVDELTDDRGKGYITPWVLACFCHLPDVLSHRVFCS